MNKKQIIDVLVVGAGPVGLTLVLDLARHGVTCRIIEQSPTAQIGTRGRGINMRTQQVFEDLGVLQALLPYDEGMPPMRNYDHDVFVNETHPSLAAQPVPPYRPFLMINQEHTEAMLRERLASFGQQVEFGTQLVNFAQEAGIVVANVTHAGQNEEIHTRYLVGSDGGHSTVRKAAGFSFLGEAWDQEHFLLANLQVSGLDTNFSHNWGSMLDRGITLSWMSHSNIWFLIATIASDEHGAFPAPSLETVQRIFDERAGLPGVHFSHPRWLSIWRPSFRMVDHYRISRIFLAGDAAHVHSAAGGQGMNTGVQDAYNLGWKLAQVLKNDAPDSLLDTYQAERLPIAQGVLATSSTRHRAFQRDMDQSLKTLFAGKEAFADVTQLSLTYRGSRLSRDLDNATGIRAGDRAPDALCIWAESSEQVRLFDLFRGTHFTLLVFGNQPIPPLPVANNRSLRVYTIARPDNTIENSDHALVDNDGQASRAYGIIGGALILVRPDGYIGLTGGSHAQEPVIDYLRDVTGR